MTIEAIGEYGGIVVTLSAALGLLVRYLFIPLFRFTKKLKNNSKEMLDSLPVLFDIAERWPQRSGSRSFLEEHDHLVDRAAINQARLYAILDLMPTAIYECDLEGNCIHANKALCDLFGLNLEQMMGSGWLAGIHPDDREKTYDRWLNAVLKKIPYEAGYRVRNAKTKIVVNAESIAFPLHENEEAVSYFGKVN